MALVGCLAVLKSLAKDETLKMSKLKTPELSNNLLSRVETKRRVSH